VSDRAEQRQVFVDTALATQTWKLNITDPSLNLPRGFGFTVMSKFSTHVKVSLKIEILTGFSRPSLERTMTASPKLKD
jgi:hypothetical protein